MRQSAFNNEIITLNKIKRKYAILFTIGFLLIMLLLIFLKKYSFYKNIIMFDNNEITLFVDKEHVDVIKNGSEIMVDNVNYNYNIEKIEENNDLYLITITFPYEVKLNEKYYKIFIKKESFLNYFIRIIGG